MLKSLVLILFVLLVAVSLVGTTWFVVRAVFRDVLQEDPFVLRVGDRLRLLNDTPDRELGGAWVVRVEGIHIDENGAKTVRFTLVDALLDHADGAII